MIEFKTVSCRSCIYCKFDKVFGWRCKKLGIFATMGEEIFCRQYENVGEKWAKDLIKMLKEEKDDS